MGMKDQFQDKANELKDKARKAKSGDHNEMSERARKGREPGREPGREQSREPGHEQGREPGHEQGREKGRGQGRQPMDKVRDELDERA